MLGRTVYTFRIANGQSVREVIRRVEAAGLPVAVQPKYTYRLAQDRNNPNTDLGDPAQYIVNKFQFAEVHQITKGDKAVVAVIDSAIDSNQPNLAGTVSDRYDAGCDTSAPHPHGTGMAGAIASHGQLVGVAPQANIIAICAFGGAGQPESSTINIIKGLDLRDPARRQDRQHELRWAARSGTRPGAADRSREGDSCDRCRWQ